MLRNEGERLRRVVVSTPREEYFRVSDTRAHNMNEVADRAKTESQFGDLVRSMRRLGTEVTDVPELEGHPNSVFTRDASLVTPEGYVRLRMGLETRRGEEEWLSKILEAKGEPRAGEIVPPGTAEGGDIVLAGEVAFVGRSERTNAEGVAQLTAILGKMGYEIRVAEVRGTLHIGGVLSAIAPERVVACRGDYPAGFFNGFDVVWVDRRGPSTGNVICVAPNEILANEAENRECMDALDRAGVTVHGVDLSEFRKGGGGPTCLILPLERN
jgi:dimethylargininase